MMALTEHCDNSQRLAVAVLLIVCLSVEATHFRGGTVRWRFLRYNPSDSDSVEVEVSHRVAWLNPLNSVYCTTNRVETFLRIPGGDMTCRRDTNSGLTCPDNFNLIEDARDFICTDYNQDVSWSSGVSTTVVSKFFPVGSSEPYFLGYSGCCWASNVPTSQGDNTVFQYGLRTSMVLTRRSNNGEINNPPITSMFPEVPVQRGCTTNIRIPIVDEDGDFVSCREADNANSLADSCFALCQLVDISFNPAGSEGPCTLRVPSITNDRSFYGVAIVAEDRYSEGGDVLSTVPLQFVLKLYGDSGVCQDEPTFVSSTPAFGSSVAAQGTNVSGSFDIVARSSADGITISNIVTLSPLRTTKTALTTVENSAGREASITVTIGRSDSEAASNEIMCFYAVQSNGVSSTPRCITVTYDAPLPEDPCLSEPCLNGGTCMALSGNTDFECECPLGYTNKTCGKVTCAQRCYTDSVVEDCYCDSFCSSFGDCCDDFSDICLHNDSVPGEPTCVNRCYTSEGVGGCFCDDLCSFFNDCCSDFYNLCPRPPADDGPGDASCVDRCYTVGNQGGCYCDWACPYYNDCCTDFNNQCVRPPVTDTPGNASCSNRCFSDGSQGGCFCDALCQGFNDCCPDFFSICPRPGNDTCEPSLCVNGGNCTAINNNTDYMCTCPEGFLGKNCQSEDPCRESPCLENAPCTPLNENTDYRCDCPGGFLGKNCQNADPCQQSPCENDANCTALDENTDYRCDCPEGFIGKNCDTALPTDPCTVPNICQNGGTCVTQPGDFNYTCNCVPGFLGDNCQDEFECPAGSSYAACITECDRRTCLHPSGPPGCDNVNCTEGCQCNAGHLLQGDQCIPSNQCGCEKDGRYYPLNAVFVNENCTEECSCYRTNSLECSSLVCSQNASCQLVDDRYMCMCNEGFVGSGAVCTPEEVVCIGYDARITCVGPECRMGCFRSPDYPDARYPPNTIIQYVLQVPGVDYFTVKCNEPFEIEDDRDSLYVGPGDPPLVTELEIDPSHPVYLFDGDDAPDRFRVDGSSLWMYLISDRIEQGRGFECCWKADDPCVDNPCSNGGRCEANSDGTYYCVCFGGWTGDHCEIGRAHCWARGDPHYHTFDGQRFDFQGACKYYLVKYCGEDDSAHYFDIIQQNHKVSTNSRAARTRDLRIHIFDHEIRLLQGKEVTIDGVLVFPPVMYPGFSIMFSGTRVVAKFNNSLEVRWDGDDTVDIMLSYQFSNQTCGLCGNMDSDRSNEYVGPDNQPVDGPIEFGNSWKANPENCSADDETNGAHPCEDLFGPELEADEVAIRFFAVFSDPEGPLGRCFEEIDPSTFLADALYDWCAARPDPSSACSNVASYASQCQAIGIEVRPWRTEEFCPLKCPDNSRYSPCMSACPRLCGEDRLDNFVCLLPCVEGCQCEDRHVLDGDQRCVPEDQCGCYFEGLYHTTSEIFLNSNCTMRCTCASGQPVCLPFSCAGNRFCGVVDGVHGCFCNEGFIDNGDICVDDPCDPNPCNNGRCVRDARRASGYYCVCFRGSGGYNCSERTQGHCYAHGDPHYRSLDGVNFNYQGGCKYVLLQPCDPGNGPAFRVIQENQKVRESGQGPSRTRAVYVEIDGTVFAFKRNRKLYVNGVEAKPPVVGFGGLQVIRRGKYLVMETPFGLEVRWNGRYDVDISLSSDYFNNTCGLCGNWNGNTEDEFGEFETPEAFGNSWAVEGQDCESDEEPTPFVCHPNPVVLVLVQEVCSIVYSDTFSSCSSLGLADSFYESCVFDLCTTYPEFPNFCPSVSFYADVCQESGLPVGIWRSPQVCPLECPEHSHYSRCMSACPARCPNGTADFCPFPCVEGCECNDGYLLSGDECVRQEECGCSGRFYLEPGDSYVNDNCTMLCTCDGPGTVSCVAQSCHENATCGVRDGQHGCYCNEGYYGDGYECQQDPCYTGEEHCSDNGECVSDGDGNFHCACRRGWSGEDCSTGMAICSGHGDPHYTSFDGRRFNYQGKCRYIVFRSTLKDEEIPFEVVAQHRPARRNRRVALTEELHIIAGDVRIELLQDREVRINGVEFNTPVYPFEGVSIKRVGKQLVLQTDFDVKLEWDGTNAFSIEVSPDYLNRTWGLCGKYDEDPDNDFTTPGGRVVEDENSFGNSWVYGHDCNETEPPGDSYNPCEENSDSVNLATQLCRIITQENGPFRECHDDINPQGYYESCLYDLCSTLPDRGALCEDVAKYADDCLWAGVEIEEWRREDFCSFRCPAGSSYRLCAPGCPMTCRDMRDSGRSNSTGCTQPCREGCQCEEGMVLSGERCVPPDQCGCYHGGAYFMQGEHFLTADCKMGCVCNDSEVQCAPIACHENAECILEDGERRCRCQEPLIGDGIEECNLNPCTFDPCENFGVCHPVGSDDYWCECTEFWTGKSCELRRGVCLSYGTQHFVTFDGASLTFEGECHYVLAKTCPDDVEPSFQVIQESTRLTPLSSGIEAIHVLIDDKKITLGRRRSVEVNGLEVELPVSEDGIEVRISGMNVVLRSPIGLEVAFDGWHAASVIVPSNFTGRLCGLCGNFDGSYANDSFIRGKPALETDVGNFYRVNDDCAVPVEPPPTVSPCDSVSPQALSEAYAFCNEVVEGPLSRCVDMPQVFKARCLFDACASRLNPYLICLHPLTVARHCRRFGVRHEPWRSLDYCPVDCPEGSHYNPSASPCPETCVDVRRNQRPRCEHERRVEACECDDGYVLSGPHCVPRDDCGCYQVQTGNYYEEGQVFMNEECSSLCTCQSGSLNCVPVSCDENAECTVSDGRRRCECSDGYLGNGMECQASPCTEVDCQNNGTCIPGPNGTYGCLCQWDFAGDYCEQEVKHCIVYGVPHYTTFSLVSYAFQGAGQYYLTRACNESAMPYFEVIQQTERILQNPRFTITEAILIHFQDVEIGLHGNYRLTVNEREILPPYRQGDLFEISMMNNRVIVTTNFNLTVEWDGFHSSIVTLSTDWASEICGLCGDMGGPVDGEIAAHLSRPGSIAAFGDRNIANPGDCPPATKPNIIPDCSDEESEQIRPFCLPLVNERGPFRRCPRELGAVAASACLDDSCALGHDVVTPICQSFSILTKLCQRLGIEVDPWRVDGFCPVTCPEHSEYKVCANACQRRCGGPVRLPAECPFNCEEGCECEDGYVLDHDSRCVRPNDCGCMDQGYYHLNEEEYYRDGCQEICQCVRGEPVCKPVACHHNATCGVHDGNYGCYCNDGYHGNGTECREDPCYPNPCENDGICTIQRGEGPPYQCSCVGHWRGDHCNQGVKSCSVSGHTHYDRFDGQPFDFYGGCKYVLARPCAEGDNSFRVILQNAPDDEFPALSRIEAVHISIGDQTVTLMQGMEFEVNGEEQHYPFNQTGIHINQYGWIVRVTTDLGLTVSWNGRDLVDVTLPSDFAQSTCGICGDITNPMEGFGEYENAREYAMASVLDSQDCQPPRERFEPCEEHTCNLQEAVEKCALLLSPKVACPPGWFSPPGERNVHVCYYVRRPEEPLTYAAAYHECASKGGRLYDPATELEALSFRNATAERHDGSYWLGCSDAEEEGSWSCHRDDHSWSNESQSGYWSWDEDQPDDGGTLLLHEDCAMVFDHEHWRDVSCHAQATLLVCQLDSPREYLTPFKKCHEVVPPYPYFIGCIQSQCATLPDDNRLCSSITAYANVCRLYGAHVGLWQSRNFCRPECPEGSFWSDCVSPCPPTCANPDRACPLPCRPGCECRQGWVRQGHRCVPREQCGCFMEGMGRFIEPGDGVFKRDCAELCHCRPGGELDCQEVNCTDHASCVANERSGDLTCQCEDGYAFMNNECQPDACTGVECANGGTCIARHGMYSCFCQIGWTGQHCEDEEAWCQVLGFSHYYTFDGTSYNFFGDCIYHLAGHCGEDVKKPLFWILEKKERHVLRREVASLYFVEVHIDDWVFTLKRDHVVLVNGVRWNLPVTSLEGVRIEWIGNRVVLHTAFGLQVFWDGHSDVAIRLPGEFKNQTCGLCSSYDGNQTNDLVPKEGDQVQSPAEFGNSWLQNDEDCRPDEGNISPVFFVQDCAEIGQINSFCANLFQSFSESCSGPYLEYYFILCIADSCLLRNPRYGCHYAAEAIAECKAQGGKPTPRDMLPEPCGVECPPNSEFSFCASPCPRTCDDVRGHDRTPCEGIPCVEGCRCKEGFVLSGVHCVPEEECGCRDRFLYGGAYYLDGQEFVSHGCREKCECDGGTFRCRPLECHCQSECTADDYGQYGCHCEHPYVGNGSICTVDPCYSNPCVNGGKCEVTGNFSYVCVCQPAWTGMNCERARKECSVYGSPQHFRTFDGANYNFFGTCWYTLAADCSEEPLFRVYIRSEQVVGRQELTKVQEVVVQSGHDGPKFGLHQHKKLTVEGRPVNTPFAHEGIHVVSGTHMLLTTPYGLTVRWNGYFEVDVWLDTKLLANVSLCGLCGNADGNADNILEETPDGRRVSNSVEFGNSWVVNPEECEDRGSDVENACNGDIELAAARSTCAIIVDENGPFAQCGKELDSMLFYDNCVFSLCASGNPDNRSLICGSLWTFESACLDLCLDVGPWRAPGFCEPPCSDGQVFEPSTPACPKTCLGVILEASLPCPFPHQAGCTCAPHLFLSGDECVPKDHCGCFYEGQYRKASEVFISHECESVCTCHPGNRVECRERGCPKGAFCGVKEEKYGCHCKPGYEDDGCGGCRANACHPDQCKNNGTCVIIGKDDYLCRCPAGYGGKNCESVLARCTVSGDPHVETFDGVRYRFGSECEHVLVHNVFEQDVPQFFVTLVTERSDTNPNVTSIKMIRILSTSQENGYYLEIRQGLILLINGVRVIPPLILPWSQIHLSGSWLVLIDHTLDLVLRWDGYNHLDVFVHSKLGEVCGLCGFYDGNNSNDFLKQTGEFTSDAVDFANSWFVINSTCEAAVELPNQCGGDSTLMVAADNACNAIRDTVGSLASCHEVIPFQPFYDKCVFDVCKSLPDTSARCSHIQDYAQRCINAGVDVGYQWRTERNCFSECPEHSHFSPCIGSCPPSCLGELLYQDPRQCFPYCNDGCECDEGYYLSDDRCVPKEECGCLLPSEISQLTVVPVGFTFMFDNCGILCSCGADGDLTCSNATCHSDAQCLIIDGVQQCVCNDSLIGNGLECNTSPCEAKPCQNGGTCIVEENLSYSCVCQRGWTGTNCMQETLYCLTYGDPHYRTFDGKYFDFMGECSYYLFRLCEADSTTSVIQVNQRVGSSAYTTMKELIINYGGTEIKLVPDVGVVVSDVVQTPPFNATPVVEIRRVGNYIVVKIPDQFDLKWDGQYSADIELTAVIGSTQFCGLCGNANNNTDDDFDDGNEQTVDTAVSFGNRQVVGNLPCPANATEQPNQCDNAFDTEFADTVCSPLLNSRDNFPFQGCSASSAEFYAACRYDVCAAVLVDPSLALPIACGVVATYAQLCQDLGHAVSEWRSAISCTQDCPRNAEYSLCADPCPPTCRDPDGDISPCNLRCAEGCTCREGFYQDGDECVPRSQCGCQYDNGQKYLRLNDDYYTNSCTMRCTCSDAFGEVVCSPAACHENATCTEVNGIQKCVCDEGFVGNGQDCVFEECADSPCAEGSQCLRRMGGSPNYVCECADNNRMGQNCDVQAEYDARYACYGADCASTWFKSPNYSQPYPNSWKGFYQLWVPGARYINVTFPEAFQVETGRDYLYLGPGFQYPLGLNQGPLSTLQGVIYQLDGYTSPGPVYIEGDAVWMYFVTDDQVNAHGWHAMLEAEFVDLPGTPVCWDGSETRPSGSTWEYGKCDECNCAAGAVIKCSLNASKPISCTEDGHCPASSTCVPSDQVPLCVTEPCSGMYCDVGTIHADCAENPFCSEVTVSAELASIIPSTTLTQLCDSLIAAAEIVSVADCFTFECSIRREARKKRAASDDTVLVDIFLESGSPSTGSAAPVSEDGMTPADALALSVYEGLSLHISDPSLPVNITNVVYLGPRPATKEPPTDSTQRVTIKKVTTGPVEANLSASSVTIVAVGSSVMILLAALVLTIWCRRRGRQSSKKTMTFQTGSEEAHTNEVFEMVDPGPAFSRAIPLDDGTGHQGNVYGVKYDLDS